MQGRIKPADEREIVNFLRDAASRGLPVDIEGAGSKRAVGRPMQVAGGLTTRGLNGITMYEPSEMVMSARAGTVLARIEEELAHKRQMLAFEPVDLGPLLGGETGGATIGAVFATNLGGARRVAAGAPRDHLLGVQAITGRAEPFKSGGRVMKNVTGYDVARGLAGSWGTLAVLTEVTFKVMPAPEATCTVVILGLPDEIAVELLTQAMGLPYEVSGAVHLQAAVAARLEHTGLAGQGKSITALRLENFKSSVDYRTERIKAKLKAYGELHDLDDVNSRSFWGELQRLSVLARDTGQVWRISTAPSEGAKVVAAISRYMECRAFYDWSGGLIWAEVVPTSDAGAADIRRVIAGHGGHATLIRAELAVRAAVEVFQPLEPGVERLTRRLKASFDPAGILNPGRMYAGI